MCDMDAELKDYIQLSISTLVQEIHRLSGVVSNQSALINDINIKSTTRIAELQKDINDVSDEIKRVREEVRNLDESQKFKWKTLGEDRSAEKRDRESKDRIQAVTNSRVNDMSKILWFIATTSAAILIGQIVSWIANGGLRGVTP